MQRGWVLATHLGVLFSEVGSVSDMRKYPLGGNSTEDVAHQRNGGQISSGQIGEYYMHNVKGQTLDRHGT